MIFRGVVRVMMEKQQIYSQANLRVSGKQVFTSYGMAADIHFAASIQVSVDKLHQWNHSPPGTACIASRHVPPHSISWGGAYQLQMQNKDAISLC